jgi:mono/diheme cytochrome c family protein
MNSCVSCHGFKADGNGPLAKVLSPKPSNLRMMSKMHPDGDFAWKIANGRGAMPAWKDKIKQRDIWAIVNYIQSLSLIQLTKTESPHDHANQHGH